MDVLDRVLDKGIVFDPLVRMCRTGIDLITAKTHLKIASVDTHLSGAYPGPGLFASSPVRFIIAADRTDLFEKWTAEFPHLAVRHVLVLDRRFRKRRQKIQIVRHDRRLAERRTHAIERELALFGLTVVVVTGV